MDWLRNWKKRMFFSVAVGMAVAVIFSGATEKCRRFWYYGVVGNPVSSILF